MFFLFESLHMTLNSDGIRADYLTFDGWKGRGGGGNMGDLVWLIFFFPQTSEDIIFCMTFLFLFCLFVCLFVFQHYTPFFFFFFSARISFVEISLQDIIFILKSPIPLPHSKVQWSAPKKTLVNRIAIPSIACEQQTYFRSSLPSILFFGGREATTGNTSVVRRLYRA